LLKLLEVHFTEHPYLLGGHPSHADYSLMGALHAHMGRDPVPLRVMQNHAPRVFRWVEHMLVPEVESPEFFDWPVEYLADDAISDSLEALLGWLSDRYAEPFRQNLLAWNAHVHSRTSDAEGTEVLADGDQQPQLPRVQIDVDGAPADVSCSPHLVWVTQRALNHYRGSNTQDRAACDAMLSAIGADALVSTELDRQVERRASRLVLGPL
jgi:hypothetical protein